MITNHYKFILAMLSILGLTSLAYASMNATDMVGSMYDQASKAAMVKIMGTSEGSDIHGMLSFWEMDNGVLVKGHLEGIAPGDHGIHIHANSSCADGGKAAGGHYDPYGTSHHGFLPKDGRDKVHLGDMGNITVGQNGQGFLKVILPGVSLDGDHGIAGHAIILHAKADDFGQPTGNAGGRIGCGVISSSASGDAIKGSMMEMKGSSSNEENTNVAISGYCPVCLINGGMVIKGSKNFVTEYKGKVYKFLGLKQQKMFFENPEKYIQNLENKFKEMKDKF